MLLVMALYVIVVDADIDCVPVESLHRREQYRLENVGVVQGLYFLAHVVFVKTEHKNSENTEIRLKCLTDSDVLGVIRVKIYLCYSAVRLRNYAALLSYHAICSACYGSQVRYC